MSEPIFVPLADIAAACGVSSHALLNRHWPAHWAVPRDWRMIPHSSTVIVHERALPDLVKELAEAGLNEAAAALEKWRLEIAPPESHAEFVARHTHAPAPAGPWYQKGQFE